MRLVSNRESVARGEVSFLAIAETVLAIALAFYLSAHFNTLRWLAAAMCVSPLLLLRTEESTRLGIEYFDRWWEWIERYSRKAGKWQSIRVLISGLQMPLLPPFSRTGATILSTIRQPGAALRAISLNWARLSLSVDSSFPPEVMPEHPTFNFDTYKSWLGKDSMSKFPRWKRWAGVPFMFGLLFLPSLLYRWSLKATSIIYAPLVFVAHSTFSEGADLRTKLELIKRGDLSRIRVWYGVLVIAAFLAKLVLMMNLPGFANWWSGHPISRFLALYVAPTEIPKWQLAELANSALAIGVMLFARHALLRYELQHPWPEARVKRLLGFLSGLRWMLALYAILCTGYITMRAAQHWQWPALGERWLPW
jgi:hypothetical protein